MFSDIDIKQAVESGELFIEGLKEESIQPASIDLHMGDQVIVVKRRSWLRKLFSSVALDPFSKESMERVFSEPVRVHRFFTLAPHQFILIATERVRLSNAIAAQVAGKSSVARLGIEVESAGFIDPGFDGPITLEVYNKLPYPIYLWPGMPICQLKVFRLDTPSSVTYKGKYQGADGPQASRYWMNPRPEGRV